MKVSAWNEYTISGNGRLIIGQNVDAVNVQSALDIAEVDAVNWNKRHKKDIANQVNIISCNGFVRVIL